MRRSSDVYPPVRVATLDIRAHRCAVFSIPPIGTVGLTEDDAAARYPRVALYQTRFTPLMHKLTGQGYKGFLCKAVVDHLSSKVLGVHICGTDAAEIIQAVGIAVKVHTRQSL